MNGRSADRHATASERTDAEVDFGSITVNHDDVIHRDSQMVGRHLRIGRLSSLTVRRSPTHDGDLSSGLDSNRGALPAAGGRRGRGTEGTDLTVR